MVVETDAEDQSGFGDAPGRVDVALARLVITGWMGVDENDAGGAGPMTRARSLAPTASAAGSEPNSAISASAIAPASPGQARRSIAVSSDWHFSVSAGANAAAGRPPRAGLESSASNGRPNRPT